MCVGVNQGGKPEQFRKEQNVAEAIMLNAIQPNGKDNSHTLKVQVHNFNNAT